jgi:hypothetical protein
MSDDELMPIFVHYPGDRITVCLLVDNEKYTVVARGVAICSLQDVQKMQGSARKMRHRGRKISLGRAKDIIYRFLDRRSPIRRQEAIDAIVEAQAKDHDLGLKFDGWFLFKQECVPWQFTGRELQALEMGKENIKRRAAKVAEREIVMRRLSLT